MTGVGSWAVKPVGVGTQMLERGDKYSSSPGKADSNSHSAAQTQQSTQVKHRQLTWKIMATTWWTLPAGEVAQWTVGGVLATSAAPPEVTREKASLVPQDGGLTCRTCDIASFADVNEQRQVWSFHVVIVSPSANRNAGGSILNWTGIGTTSSGAIVARCPSAKKNLTTLLKVFFFFWQRQVC